MWTIRSTASGRPTPTAERSGAAPAGPPRSDRGVAIVGTLVGFLIFLVLLLFAAQALIHLYATSALTAAANKAAETVAQSPQPAEAIPAAEAAARSQLGRFGATRTTFAWKEVDANQVVVEIQGRTAGLTVFVPAWRTVTRTVTVRTERFR